MLADSSGRRIVLKLDGDPESFRKHRPQVAAPELRKIWNIEQPASFGIDRARDRKHQLLRDRIDGGPAFGGKPRRYFHYLFRVAVPWCVGLGPMKHPSGAVDGGQTQVRAAQITR
jgi:hypothetical protein